MTDFLARFFIEDYKDYKNPAVRAKYGTLASTVGITVNIFLSAFKLVAGLLAASISVVADALNNLTDAGASVVSLLGFKLASKPADKDHPFGHARMEYIASMIVSFIILLVGVELLTDSVSSLINPDTQGAKISLLTVIILSLSVLTKLWLALFSLKIGKRIESTAVKAAGTDSLSDAISTTVILISALIMYFTEIYFIDALMGAIVSIIIIIAGVKILNETKNSILGEAPVEETVEAIRAITAEYPDIIGIHDMMVHNYGPGRFIASFHAEVDGRADIFALHDTIDLVEKRISTELGIPCSIHMDPIDKNDETVNRLKAVAEDALAEVYPALTLHDFRVVTGQTHTNMIFDVVVPFEIKDDPKEITENIGRAVSAKDSKLFCVITVDRA